MGRDPPPSQPDVPITSHHHQSTWKNQPWSSQRAAPALIHDNQEFASGFRQSWVKPGTVNTLLYFTLKAQLNHTEQRQDAAHGIYSAKNPKAQGEDQQWQQRILSSPLQKYVKPSSLAASCKLKLLTAVQGSVLFFHHSWQMVRAIIKTWFPAYNSNCMKTSALGQQLTIFILGKSRRSLAVK